MTDTGQDTSGLGVPMYQCVTEEELAKEAALSDKRESRSWACIRLLWKDLSKHERYGLGSLSWQAQRIVVQEWWRTTPWADLQVLYLHQDGAGKADMAACYVWAEGEGKREEFDQRVCPGEYWSRKAREADEDRRAILAILDSERAEATATKGQAWDWQQRAERAEGHLRLLGSYGGCVSALLGTVDGQYAQTRVASWYPPGCNEGPDLDSMICRILTAQQEDQDEQG